MPDQNGAAKRPKPYLRQEADDDDSPAMKPEPYLHQPAPVEAED
jgi:hypothetical protein